MTFLFDENISPDIVESLRPLDKPVVHVVDVDELGRGFDTVSVTAVRFGGVLADRPSASKAGGLIARARRLYGEEAELVELLEAAIGALDSPELEQRMAAGTEYRLALEDEIARVVQSDEWKWYTEGEHYRELPFVQLVSRGKWRVGAFDLFRPGAPNWIIDFKTHDIGPEDVEATAADHRLQALLYQTAANALAGQARVQLHFTKPSQAIEVTP